MRIEYSRIAVKALQRMDQPLRKRIHDAILGLTETPPRGDIKPMEGQPSGRYRLRVGDYRVIYRYDGSGAMIVLYIDDRSLYHRRGAARGYLQVKEGARCLNWR